MSKSELNDVLTSEFPGSASKIGELGRRDWLIMEHDVSELNHQFRTYLQDSPLKSLKETERQLRRWDWRVYKRFTNSVT